MEHQLQEIWIDNGTLRFSVLPERGMDIGEVYLNGTRMSWQRNPSYKLHPDAVDLRRDGWEKGFFAAVATLGPEVFGTPDETNTDHGTGAYSMADPATIRVEKTTEYQEIRGIVNIRGYELKQRYQKEIMIRTWPNSNYIMRVEVTENLTDERMPIDDGYHIQFCGDFLEHGGEYVLPVPTHRMQLRDSAPTEGNPKKIYPLAEPFTPIRCYQYIPERVYGLEQLVSPGVRSALQEDGSYLAAEMIASAAGDYGAVVIRPLSDFPRTLLAKRNDGCAMYAIEACKSRPNSLRQKAIDGELQYLEPHGTATSRIAFGFFDDEASVTEYKKRIESAALYEKKMEQEGCWL